MKRPVLLLAAASGLQLSSDHKLKFPDGVIDSRKEELADQLSRCYGPHVGSYRNKVFKRFMYATKLPMMIFVSDDKIDCEIEVGKCHFILDSELTWSSFYREYPLAFCVGCMADQVSKQADLFKGLGFEVMEENSAAAVGSFVARNAAFIKLFEEPLGLNQAQ